jgi:hypothetical protein
MEELHPSFKPLKFFADRLFPVFLNLFPGSVIYVIKGSHLDFGLGLVENRAIQHREDRMKFQKMLFIVSVVFLLVSSAAVASAGDFDWIKDFNITAYSDESGFRARLATRFNIGDTQISAVLSNVESPANAYMVLRLGEMSAKPTDYVIKQYKTGKGKGWGALAQSLGIKPGSKEFHALKSGSDLYADKDKGNGSSKGKGKGKGRK